MSYTLITHTLFGAAPGTLIGAAVALTSPTVGIRHVDVVEALHLKVSSVAGAANVKAQYQTSWDNVNWDAAADNALIVTSSLTDKPGNTEGWNTYPMPAPLAHFIRIVVTEISAGGLADTLLEAKLLCRESVG
jgi:hypothetical protein